MGAALSCLDNTMAVTSSAISSTLGRLKELGINFIALDFDQTILDTHTGGRWREPIEELFPHVRPVFAHLIQAAAEDPDMHLGIVTFSRQPHVVRAVLDHIVGPEASQKIPIRGEDRSWEYNGGGSDKGKQPHMASAVEELESRNASTGLQISKATTVLIDDDSRNIHYALKDGTRGIWFNPNKPHLLLQDIMKLV